MCNFCVSKFQINLSWVFQVFRPQKAENFCQLYTRRLPWHNWTGCYFFCKLFIRWCSRKERMTSKNAALAGGLMVLIGAAASFPYFVRSRQTETTIGQRDKLSPSQRQRGMYMNSGSDAGPDPDYNPATGEWKGYAKRHAQRQAAAERKK